MLGCYLDPDWALAPCTDSTGAGAWADNGGPGPAVTSCSSLSLSLSLCVSGSGVAWSVSLWSPGLVQPGAAQAWSWRHQAAITRSSCSLRLYLLCLSLLCSQCYTTYAVLCCYIIVMGVKCTMVSGCSCYRGVVGNTLFQKFQFMLYLNGT